MEEFLRNWKTPDSNNIGFDNRGLGLLHTFMQDNLLSINSPILLVYDGMDGGRFPISCNAHGINVLSVINDFTMVWIARITAHRYYGIDANKFRYSKYGDPPFESYTNYFDHIFFLSDIKLDCAIKYVQFYSSNKVYLTNKNLAKELAKFFMIESSISELKFGSKLKLWTI